MIWLQSVYVRADFRQQGIFKALLGYVTDSLAKRPDVVGDPVIRENRSRGEQVEMWFDTSAFAQPAQFTFGNAGRNILEAPGTFKWDMALHKNFQPTERFRIQFRAEVFNSLNHPIFDSPNETVGNRNFGIISNAAPGRVVQMGLKVIF